MITDLKTTEVLGSREHRARKLAALGDPHRLGIVELLSVQDLSPDALSAALEIPSNLLAHHLKVLTSAGVVHRVHSQNDKRRTYLQLIGAVLDGLLPEPAPLTAPRVLFVCTHNSARSILAEALWLEASDVPGTSAGARPIDQINPRARMAAARNGLRVADRAPQNFDDVLLPDDVVVSVCDAVNEELGDIDNPRIHWSIPDPAAIGTDEAFDNAIDELRGRVIHLSTRLKFQGTNPTRKVHS